MRAPVAPVRLLLRRPAAFTGIRPPANGLTTNGDSQVQSRKGENRLRYARNGLGNWPSATGRHCRQQGSEKGHHGLLLLASATKAKPVSPLLSCASPLSRPRPVAGRPVASGSEADLSCRQTLLRSHLPKALCAHQPRRSSGSCHRHSDVAPGGRLCMIASMR